MTLKKHILQFLALRVVDFEFLVSALFLVTHEYHLGLHPSSLALFPAGGDYLLQGIYIRAKGCMSVSLFKLEPLRKMPAFPQDWLVIAEYLGSGAQGVRKSKLTLPLYFVFPNGSKRIRQTINLLQCFESFRA